MNEEIYDPTDTLVDLVDFDITFGAFISRSQNKRFAIEKWTPPLKQFDKPNYTIYTPDST